MIIEAPEGYEFGQQCVALDLEDESCVSGLKMFWTSENLFGLHNFLDTQFFQTSYIFFGHPNLLGEVQQLFQKNWNVQITFGHPANICIS